MREDFNLAVDLNHRESVANFISKIYIVLNS